MKGPLVLAVLISGLQSLALAADDGAAADAAARRAALADPTLTSLARGDDPEIVLEATEDGAFVVGAMGWKWAAWNASLKLRAPLDKGKEISLANLDGPIGDTVATVSLNYQWEREPNPAGSPLLPLCQRYNESVVNKSRSQYAIKKAFVESITVIHALCDEYNKGRTAGRLLPIQAADLPPGVVLPEGYSDFCTLDSVRAAWSQRADLAAFDVAKGKVTESKLAEMLFDGGILLDSQAGECSYRNLAALGPEWEIRAFRTMPVKPWFFTVAASLAEPEFKFVDAETFDAMTVSKGNTAFSAQLGTLRSGTWWSLTYTRKTTHQAGQARELCSPAGDAGNLLCREVRLGAPTEKKQDIGQIDVKRFLSPSFAAIGRLLYDFDESAWEPHLLLFFLQKRAEGKVQGLEGGLDLAYDDDNTFSARLFVGTRFDMGKP